MLILLIVLSLTFPLHSIAFTDSISSVADLHPILEHSSASCLPHICIIYLHSHTHQGFYCYTCSLFFTLSLSLYHSPLCLLGRDRPGSPGRGIPPNIGGTSTGAGITGSSPVSLLYVTPSKRSEDVQKLGDLVRAFSLLLSPVLLSYQYRRYHFLI